MVPSGSAATCAPGQVRPPYKPDADPLPRRVQTGRDRRAGGRLKGEGDLQLLRDGLGVRVAALPPRVSD